MGLFDSIFNKKTNFRGGFLKLESIENNSDVIVHLLMNNHNMQVDIHDLDWNIEYPVLAEGSNLFLDQNLSNIIQQSLATIGQDQLPESTLFPQLRNAIMETETVVVAALKNNIPNIKTSIDNAITDNLAIDVASQVKFIINTPPLNPVHHFHYYICQFLSQVYTHYLL